VERWCWLAVLPIVLAFVLVRGVPAGASSDDPLLVLLLNAVLLGGLSLVSAFLGARAYLATGDVAVLFLGAGMLVLGVSRAAAAFAGSERDTAVTITRAGACLAGALNLGSAATALLRNRGPQRQAPRAGILSAAYLPAILAVGAVTVGAALEAIPHFYVQAGGFSPEGEFVLGAAIAEFLSAGLIFMAVSTRRSRRTLRWHGTGLVILALGLGMAGFAVPGTAMDWLGHSSLCLGAGFVLVAVLRTGGAPGAWGGTLEEALRASEERLRVAARAARAGTWEWDIGSDRATWSAELAQMLQLEPPVAGRAGASFFDVIHPADRGRVEEQARAALRERRGFESEFRIVSPAGGGVRWIHTAATLLMAPAGEPNRIVGFAMDVTERKRIEREMVARNRIAEIYLAIPDQGAFDRVRAVIQETLESPLGLVGLIDEAGDLVVQSFSPGVWEQCAVEGKSRTFRRADWGDAWGRALREGRPIVANDGCRVPPGHVPLLNALSVPVLNHGRSIGLYLVANRPGGYGPEEVSLLEGLARQAAPVIEARLRERAEERERMAASAALKESEDRLRALNAELEDRVLDRTGTVRHQAQQLRELASELTRAEQRERQRLAKLLHDHLQQTLSAARLHVGIISSRVTDPDSAEAAVQVDELLAQSIEESRSLAVQLSPPVLREGGLAAGLRWLARDMRERHALAVEVAAEAGAEVADEDARVLMYESARELLFNVVKHAGVSHARVTLGRRGPLTVLAVEDTGRGFDPAKLRSAGATSGGFGLFSIQSRVEVMGGQFAVESSPGLVRVQVSMPSGAVAEAAEAAAEPRQAAEAGRAPGAHCGRIRVLLADDHKIMRQGLAILLETERDLEVVGEAQDGEEAVTLALALRPDVVVMDVSMPKLNGVEATRRIHASLPDASVIGLSMFDEAAIELALREAGASAYLTKGGPSDDLVRSIREAAMHRCSEGTPPAR
jgi:PAS domain S-box-containing protein